MKKPWLLPGACSCLQSLMNFEMSGNKTINIAELAINSCPMDLAQWFAGQGKVFIHRKWCSTYVISLWKYMTVTGPMFNYKYSL